MGRYRGGEVEELPTLDADCLPGAGLLHGAARHRSSAGRRLPTRKVYKRPQP